MPVNTEKLIDFWTSNRINHLIKTMFVDTADDNYVVARWAAMNDLHIDFYWNGMHAVEKYLKAALMYNDISAREYKHNISLIFEKVKATLTSFEIGVDRFPALVHEIPELYDINIDKFVDRLNKFGSTQSRYLEVSYNIGSHDIHSLDNFIWYARRYIIKQHASSSKLDDAEILKNVSVYHGRLEEILSNNDKRLIRLKNTLLAGNFAFDPDNAKLSMRYAAGRSSMLEWTISDLERNDSDPVRKAGARRTLLWVLENMPINNDDKKEIIKRLNIKYR